MRDIVRQRGFTLAELLIVVVIIAILAGVGVPAMRDLVLSNRQTAAVNELVTALQMARGHAITRGEGRDVYTGANATVVVCASSDGATCGGAWNEGWIIFLDSDGNGVPADADGGVLRTFSGHSTLAMNAGAGLVRFGRNGRVTGAVTFTICDERGDAQAREVNLNLTGRPSLRKGANCGG